MRDDDRRLSRLRDLVARLERLPESAHREWMLAEVRARMVDVDTGSPPQPLRPLREAEPPPATTRPTKRPPTMRPEPTRDAGVEPREAAPAQQSSHSAGAPTEDRSGDRRVESDEAPPLLVDPDHVLWLEDSPDATENPPGSELPRWRRGLRG